MTPHETYSSSQRHYMTHQHPPSVTQAVRQAGERLNASAVRTRPADIQRQGWGCRGITRVVYFVTNFCFVPACSFRLTALDLADHLEFRTRVFEEHSVYCDKRSRAATLSLGLDGN